MDRKSERLKYVVTAPGLVLIALFLGFLSIFVGVRLRRIVWPSLSAWDSGAAARVLFPFCFVLFGVRCAFLSLAREHGASVAPR